MTQNWKSIQAWAGVAQDGIPGPATATAIVAKLGLSAPGVFDRAAFLARYVNLHAAAIDDADRALAAQRLGVTYKHIHAIEEVESSGTSFDNSGRPIILPEPHVFYRLTNGAFGVTDFSYPKWGTRPYPPSYDTRWALLATMAEHDEGAALQSASWGLFQVMGEHWKVCGYDSPQAFAAAMAADEANHLTAAVAFILSQGLDDELRACKADDPASCVPFVSRYNGPGYRKNNYDVRFSEALR